VHELFTFDNALALATLTILEIVLGIDNIVFLAILSAKLPPHRQPAARRIGLGLAMIMRIMLLLAIGWVMGLTAPLFSIPEFWTRATDDLHAVSGRDLILLIGGLFLMAKATFEIHDKLEGTEHGATSAKVASFGMVIVQIVLIDIVFSLDSVITAVGMVQADATKPWIGLTIMVTAVVAAVLVMLIFAGPISRFVERNPTMKMLAHAYSQGLHLFRHGLFGGSGVLEYAAAPRIDARQVASELRGNLSRASHRGPQQAARSEIAVSA
jgi:predicted tellurium resistance membrane protein TerC